MLCPWEGQVLLQSQQLDKGNLAGLPQILTGTCPSLADLKNRGYGGPYQPGAVGTRRVALSPIWDTMRNLGSSLTCLEHHVTCQPEASFHGFAHSAQ